MYAVHGPPSRRYWSATSDASPVRVSCASAPYQPLLPASETLAVGAVPVKASGATEESVGTTGLMVPSALNSSRSIVVSRCVPSPPGIAKRW